MAEDNAFRDLASRFGDVGNRRPRVGKILSGASMAHFRAFVADRYYDFWNPRYADSILADETADEAVAKKG